MDVRARHDRTMRLLEARLEAIAAVSERSLAGPASFEREILRAAAATRHAIALGLLSAEEADAIWTGAARRHPRLPCAREGFGLAA